MKHDTYFDIVWRQFKKNRFAYVALWLLLPLVLIAIFAPILASNVPFYFHDARQTLVCDTTDTTPIFQDIGRAIPLAQFRADELAKAGEVDAANQLENEGEAPAKTDGQPVTETDSTDNAGASDGDSTSTDTSTDESVADEATEESADENTSEIEIPKQPKNEVEKTTLAFETFEKQFAETPVPWLMDEDAERLWVRRGDEIFVYRHIPQFFELTSVQPLMILTAVDRQPQIPGRITNIDWFAAPSQTLILRDGRRTLVFRDVAPPKIEIIEAPDNQSQQLQAQTVEDTQATAEQQTEQTGSDDGDTAVTETESGEPAEPDFMLQFTRAQSPTAENSATLVFEATSVGRVASTGSEVSDAVGHYRITYERLPEPSVVAPRATLAFTRTMGQYPWFRTLLNPGASVDYMFNIALICFIPWAILCFFLYRYWRRREVSGRLAVTRLAGIFGLIIVTFAFIFLFSAVRPSNKWKERTFPAEAFDSSWMKWGVYPLIPFGPAENDAGASDRPPGFVKARHEMVDSNDAFPHILGTDSTGADALTRMIYGSRISLSVGMVAVGIYMTIGIIIGAIAGYFGGWVDLILSRFIEVIMLFPALFLILTIVALYGKSIYVVMVVIGITGWPGIARLTRGEVLKQRQIEYVTAARALGGSNFRIIFRHILPNALSPAMVAAPFGIAGAIIIEAGLSLLGFGAQPSEPTWGNLLNIASHNYNLWWLIIFPTIAIFVTVTLLNLIGNGLRDAMDPRLRR